MYFNTVTYNVVLVSVQSEVKGADFFFLIYQVV